MNTKQALGKKNPKQASFEQGELKQVPVGGGKPKYVQPLSYPTSGLVR
jgi:hypothetical protein